MFDKSFTDDDNRRGTSPLASARRIGFLRCLFVQLLRRMHLMRERASIIPFNLSLCRGCAAYGDSGKDSLSTETSTCEILNTLACIMSIEISAVKIKTSQDRGTSRLPRRKVRRSRRRSAQNQQENRTATHFAQFVSVMILVWNNANNDKVV